MQKNQVARFTSSVPGSILVVFLRRGKGGINTSVRLRQEGQKTQTGAGTSFTHEQEDEAQAEWQRLQDDAVAKGWTLKEGQSRSTRSAFTEIPVAPGAVVEPTELAATGTAGAPKLVKKNGKKS